MGEVAAGLRLHSLVCDGSDSVGCTTREKKKKLNQKTGKRKKKREKRAWRHGMPRWDGAQVEQHRKSWLL